MSERLVKMLEQLQTDAVMSKFATARECNAYRSAVADMLVMLRAVPYEAEGKAIDLLRRVRKANIIFPSMCANNTVAYVLVDEIKTFIDSLDRSEGSK